jgi:L-2,4-diaminobutyrate decarboxylase
VDAAYGFGALFSDHLAARVPDLARADSITVDLHKLGWQPAAASVLLVRDGAVFETLDRSVDYLNPVDDREAGYDGLLGRTLQTTRRADAVKVAATLLAHGRRGLGRMVDACHRLACHAESRISADPRLELVAPATLTTVVFRFRAVGADGVGADRINAELRRRLLRSGTAVIGRTTVAGATCLKLTLLNPSATESDVDAMVTAVLAAGDEVEAELEGDR